MTRAATPENEEVLLDTARYGTASDVERQVRHYRRYKRIEKLERMASAFLSNSQSQASAGDAFLVNIHTNVETLCANGDGAESVVDEGTSVSAETSPHSGRATS